jgi:hypothetical protein
MRGDIVEALSTHEAAQAAQTVQTFRNGVPGELDAGARDMITRTLLVEEMYVLYRQGATLDEVGVQAGITAERVRQLFKGAGLKTRSPAQAGRLKRELPKAAVREILKTQIPLHQYRTLRRKPAAKRYEDHELLGFLRKAGAARRATLSLAFYDDFANGRYTTDRRRWPTHQTHCKRFGSWRNALHAAGMQANEQLAGCEAAFDADHCLQAIQIVQRKLGRTPTSLEYTRCARDSAGSLPSLSTIRNRCGSWLAALDAAERERVAA